MHCVVRQKRYLLCVTFVRPNAVPRNPWIRMEIPLQYKMLCFLFDCNFVNAVFIRCDFSLFFYKLFRLFIVFLYFPYVLVLSV